NRGLAWAEHRSRLSRHRLVRALDRMERQGDEPDERKGRRRFQNDHRRDGPGAHALTWGYDEAGEDVSPRRHRDTEKKGSTGPPLRRDDQTYPSWPDLFRPST